jgi:hypothetical protein
MTDKGRPRKYKSKEEADKAAKEYQKKYLEVRRARYNQDAEYRKKVVERDRSYYREKNNFVPKNFGSNAGRASEFTVSAKEGLNTQEMADFIGVRDKIFKDWIQKRKFPAPTHFLNVDFYYTLKQANNLAGVISRGLYNRGAFRTTDTEVIAALERAMKT